MSEEGFLQQQPGFATKAIHVGQEPEQWNSNAVVPPITLSTTFKQEAPAMHKGFEYARSGNPTRSVLEACLASLDDAKYALSFASGLGATTSVVHLLKAGDHMISVDDVYGGTYRYFNKRPLNLGADVVVYSLTKFVNGHSDVVMGAVTTNNEDVHTRLRFLQNALGIVPSPFDCYLVNRSLKTLHIRMREHMKNGLEVARYLEKHPLVEKVMHPGLPSHPQHELAKRQCYGHSGVFSIYIKGGPNESSEFLKALKYFALAESLGGYESLAELPSLMTHASIPREEREKIGITDSLVRLSVGLETSEDLIADLEQALKAAASINKTAD